MYLVHRTHLRTHTLFCLIHNIHVTKQIFSVTQAGHSFSPASAASASAIGLASHNITVLLCGENKIYLEIQKLESAMGGAVRLWSRIMKLFEWNSQINPGSNFIFCSTFLVGSWKRIRSINDQDCTILQRRTNYILHFPTLIIPSFKTLYENGSLIYFLL